jgi:hypothetical protein
MVCVIIVLAVNYFIARVPEWVVWVAWGMAIWYVVLILVFLTLEFVADRRNRGDRSYRG